MRIIGFLMAAAVLMAGCGSADPKEPKPTAAPTATATIPVPTMPPQAKAKTVKGAAVFVAYYVDLLNFASATGDVRELQDASDPSCQGCAKYISLYQSTYRAGGYLRGSIWRLSDLQPEVQAGQPVIFARVDVAQGTFRAKKNAIEKANPAEVAKLTFLPILGSENWKIKVLALQAGTK